MKQLAFSLAGAVSVILIIMILLSLHSRDIRRVELERSIKQAGEQSLRKACITDTGEIGDNDALIADFISNFLGKMKSDGKDIDIEIRSADIYKGILSAKVTEQYIFPNGKKGKIEAEATSIVERESRRPTVCVNYYIPWEVARDAGFDYREGEKFLYCTRRMSKGYVKEVNVSVPEVQGHEFRRWDRTTGDADGNTDYMAVYA
ncbi:MAG: hypothetical protein PUG68_00925 [Lachnospiraceae bacterium]|nr:hypothetical protein [Lachnospiraceae bacterium]MDD7326355.1 hypothetical protein [Lachnospiraceae bacterium]MDY2759814.1 hypothetical protein [Lachnospiraceae bacterium]